MANTLRFRAQTIHHKNHITVMGKIEQKDNTSLLMKIVLGFMGAVVLFALIAFLVTSDGYGSATGLQVILAQDFWYIFWMVAFISCTVVCCIWASNRYEATQEVGKLVLPLLLALIFLALAFGKACTDKANDGVTSPGGRPTSELVAPSN